MNRLKLFIPLVAFVFVAAFFYVVLNRIDQGNYSPQDMPSALINKPFPEFSMASLENSEIDVSRADFLGEIVLINVWATWCPSCHVEHGYLNYLTKEKGVVIVGVNYKDEAKAANAWLKEKGNPYKVNIFDALGRLGLDMGVTGAPETYVVDHRGFVRMRFQGPVNETVWREKFGPLVERLQKEQQESAG